MTREEFMAKHGDQEVELHSYHKFTFTLRKYLGDSRYLSVQVGGNADDIYREDFQVGTRYLVRDLEPFAGVVYLDGASGHVTEDEFYDY